MSLKMNSDFAAENRSFSVSVNVFDQSSHTSIFNRLRRLRN